MTWNEWINKQEWVRLSKEKRESKTDQDAPNSLLKASNGVASRGMKRHFHLQLGEHPRMKNRPAACCFFHLNRISSKRAAFQWMSYPAFIRKTDDGSQEAILWPSVAGFQSSFSRWLGRHKGITMWQEYLCATVDQYAHFSFTRSPFNWRESGGKEPRTPVANGVLPLAQIRLVKNRTHNALPEIP